MNSKSGEVVIGLLIGLAVGCVMLYVGSAREAQNRADATGVAVNQWTVISEEPGDSTLKVIAPAAAGAGIGWLLEEVSGSDKGGRNTSISIRDNDGNVNINVGDSSEDNDTRTDTDNNDSNNLNY